MPRRALFDPSDRDRFNAERQRFDWSLLQNGSVHRYDTAFHLRAACDRLAGLGYLVHRIDGSRWTSASDMFDALADAMSYRRSYGGSTSALADVFADVGAFDFGSDPATTGTVLAIAGFDTVAGTDRRTAHLVLDHFAREARLAGLYGHPMLCLVESAARDLGPVGGVDVHRGSVWDAEPDPPWPFHDTDIVEHLVHAYLTEPAGAEYVAALREVLTDALAGIGRWQVVGPAPVPESTARFHERYRSEPPPVGTRLMEVSIGIRGEGDHTALADKLVRVVHDAGLQFDEVISGFHPAGSEAREAALTRFPELR
ncbi:barstar family protein [Rhodococcus sp. NPDC058505]|uniref:barstar family protein n=1 Tax=Rhodococcus sp. NPDC058505 TaxID=3346531 RepID=UPI003646FE82